MVNRRPSPAIVVPEGVVRVKGGKEICLFGMKNCILFGDTLSFSFSFFLLYLANDNSSHVKGEVERCLIMDNIKFNRK